jgi:hypothetical protein
MSGITFIGYHHSQKIGNPNKHGSNQTLENTEGATINGQFRKTGNIDEEKQNKNTTQNELDTTIRNQTEIT